MEIEQDFEGEVYEIDVRMEDKDRLRHIAHYPIKTGPRTFKSVNVFEVMASKSGKKLVYFWKSRLAESGSLKVEEETQFRCRPEELERLFAVLDNLEEIVDLERGEHLIFKKESPSTEAAMEAIQSIQGAKSEGFDELIIQLIESASEVGSNIDDIDVLIQGLNEEILGVENLISYARSRSTLENFRELIQEREDESEYQDFLEKNPWLFGNRYIRNSEIRQLTRDEEVDFCLETINGYFDVFEIKRPDHNVLNYDSSHDSFYAAAELSKAIAQVEIYINEIEQNYSDILVKDDMNVLKPRGIIVIGADLKKEELEGLRIFNSYLNRIEVMTYNQLVGMGERLIEVYEEEIPD